MVIVESIAVVLVVVVLVKLKATWSQNIHTLHTRQDDVESVSYSS